MACPPEFRTRALGILQDLVRIDTTNPPGNETACARYLQNILSERKNIHAEVLEAAPGRGSLLARLPGEGRAKPLLLMGHLDVVAADPREWTVEPFGAEIRDGFIWGRGTTDNKNMVAIATTIMLALAHHDHPLRRDLILAATADEEHGGKLGVKWLTDARPEILEAECALNEGGGSAFQVGEHTFFTYQVAEKGPCRTIWRARGHGGHGSQPDPESAPVKLCRALARLRDGYLNPRVTLSMRQALIKIARKCCPDDVQRVQQLLARKEAEEAMRLIGFEDEALSRFRALFYDTASVTVLRAGSPESINVVPPIAQALVDGRILPGQTPDGFVGSLRDRVSETDVEIEIYQGDSASGLESLHDDPLVDTMACVLAEYAPDAELIPWMCAGSTDAKHLAPKGVPVYGFIPSPPLPDGIQGAGAHSVDERLWLDSFYFALDVLYDVVQRFCQ